MTMSMFTRRATIIRKNRRSVRRPQGFHPTPSPIPLTHMPITPSVFSTTPSPVINGSLHRLHPFSCRGSLKDSDSLLEPPENIITQSDDNSNFEKVDTKVIFEDEIKGHEHVIVCPEASEPVVERDKAPSEEKYDYSVDNDADYDDSSAFMLQMREACKDVDNSCEFVSRTFGVICNSVLATIFLGVLMIVPVGMMSIGVKFLGDCPKQPKIPIYLLVGGCFGILFLVVIIWRQIQYRRLDSFDTFDDLSDERGFKSAIVTDFMLALFHVVWLILGTVWVFSEWQPRYHPIMREPSNWCNKNAYVFAAVQIIGCYVLLGVTLILIVVLIVCYKCTNTFDVS